MLEDREKWMAGHGLENGVNCIVSALRPWLFKTVCIMVVAFPFLLQQLYQCLAVEIEVLSQVLLLVKGVVFCIR